VRQRSNYKADAEAATATEAEQVRRSEIVAEELGTALRQAPAAADGGKGAEPAEEIEEDAPRAVSTGRAVKPKRSPQMRQHGEG
jgi:hypothetical protein